jgi:hypothetical protein
MPYVANKTTFRKGAKPGPGRPRKTAVMRATEKIIKRYAEQNAETFKEACDNLLPKALSRVQKIIKAEEPSTGASSQVRAFEALRDSVYGKPPQAITGAGGGPLIQSFIQILNVTDGSKMEKFGRTG